jgi:hypothetical protein
VLPKVSANCLSTEGTSPGVPIPTAHEGEESPRPTVSCDAPSASRALPGQCTGRSQPASYGAAHRFSQPLSDFFLSPPSHHFQVGGARGFHPTRGCSSREASVARHHRHTLLTLLLWTARSPILGGGIQGRAYRCLELSAGVFHRLQGLFPRVSRSASSRLIKVTTTDLPFLGFCLLMVCTPATGQGFRPMDRHRFTTPDPSPGREPLRSTAFRLQERTHSCE